MPNLENQCVLHFELQCQKLLRLCYNTVVVLFCIDLCTKPYRGLWLNWTHLPLYRNTSVKICFNSFLSSDGYYFKTNYLNDKMRYRILVHIFLNSLALPSLQHEYYFWHRRSKLYEKAIKFYPEIFGLNVFVRSNNENNRFDLVAWYVWCHYCSFFFYC